MPVKLESGTYYRTKELCRKAGVSRSTLLRWLENGILRDATSRDRRGWRLFTEADVRRIKAEANRIK
jgi:excisionase family DNA binding protein